MPDIFPYIYLASTSPRRQTLLEEQHISYECVKPSLDDAHLTHPKQIPPQHWVAALAYFKAASALDSLPATLVPGALVLGADTVVELDGQIIGQPTSRQHARQMIHSLADRVHDVMTGVALIDPQTGIAQLLTDRATVTVGPIAEQDIETYLDLNSWQGKAGAYNLAERLAAGWPIDVQGDPATVMGLPMGLLLRQLRVDQ